VVHDNVPQVEQTLKELSAKRESLKAVPGAVDGAKKDLEGIRASTSAMLEGLKKIIDVRLFFL
jgi:hypothetical protein